MLCCVGLFAGLAIGSMLGGPWTFVAPVLGFGLGLVGDMKLMRGHHNSHRSSDDRYGGVEHIPEKHNGKDEDLNRLRNEPEAIGR